MSSIITGLIAVWLCCSNSITTDFVAQRFPSGEIQPTNATHFQASILTPHIITSLLSWHSGICGKSSSVKLHTSMPSEAHNIGRD